MFEMDEDALRDVHKGLGQISTALLLMALTLPELRDRILTFVVAAKDLQEGFEDIIVAKNGFNDDIGDIK